MEEVETVSRRSVRFSEAAPIFSSTFSLGRTSQKRLEKKENEGKTVPREMHYD